MEPGRGTERQYKIRLASGRVLGPIDRERVRLLILKNHIVGTESAREHPQGDWVDIHQIPQLADLLVAQIEGRLSLDQEVPKTALVYEPLPGSAGPTQVLTRGYQRTSAIPATAAFAQPTGVREVHQREEEETVVGALNENDPLPDADQEHTLVQPKAPPVAEGSASYEVQLDSTAMNRNIATERTVVFQRGTGAVGTPSSAKEKTDFRAILIRLVAGIGLAIVGYDLLFKEDAAPPGVRPPAIRAILPAPSKDPANPKRSKELYEAALREYGHDNVIGYRKAVGRLQAAITADANNTQAYAMLASAYLNLIDSSNKDEKYFQVISSLIQVARAKASDIIETVIADIEFYVTIGKPEAAFQRMVEFTKDRTEYGQAHFLYMAYAMFQRGDYSGAAGMLSNIADNRVTTPKIFYLRGRVAERLNDVETAIREYEKAIRLDHFHAKSYLKVAELRTKQGKIKEITKYIDFLVLNGDLLDPIDLGRAYYLQCQLFQVFEKWNEALGSIDKAVILDRENADYILERYTLLTKVGDSIEKVQGQARMYYFLSEGQKAAKAGNFREAITYFLQARQNNPHSPLPLVRLGDMFLNSSDVVNARAYLEKAAQLAPKSPEIWSKYIFTLIQGYEFDDAKKAMDRFKDMKAGQSLVDKLNGDLYGKLGRPLDAQAYYIKAMGRDSIDPTVYIAFANSLLETKNFKEAPFFFALARRFDPLNIEALLGTARASAASDGPDRAIGLLQDEMQKGNPNRAELLTGIAEFQIQKGEWDAAQSFIDQAMAINAHYAPPFKLQAQVWLNKEHAVRSALDKALDAYKSYSDRNPSDPSGYLERYKIFVKKAEFEKADYELIRVHQVFPKFPNLHYYRGALYSLMGNHPLAIHEFELELKNNPRGVGSLLALGKEYLEVERNDEALKQFNQAMQLAPQMADPKQWAGYANFKLKNFEGAVLLYRAAIQQDAGNPSIYKRLGMAYRAMGNGLEAKRAFRKYLEMEPDAPDKAEFERFL